MKGGGKGADAGAAATAAVVLVLLVAAMQLADAAVARRLGTGGGVPVSDALSAGPKPNPCTHDPNNPGQKCNNSPGHQQDAAAQKQEHSSPAVSVVSKATSWRNNPCTFNPNDPKGKQCNHPPLTAP